MSIASRVVPETAGEAVLRNALPPARRHPKMNLAKHDAAAEAPTPAGLTSLHVSYCTVSGSCRWTSPHAGNGHGKLLICFAKPCCRHVGATRPERPHHKLRVAKVGAARAAGGSIISAVTLAPLAVAERPLARGAAAALKVGKITWVAR